MKSSFKIRNMDGIIAPSGQGKSTIKLVDVDQEKVVTQQGTIKLKADIPKGDKL